MTEQAKRPTEINIKIKSIQLDSFEVTEDGKTLEKQADSKYEFQIGVKFNFDKEDTAIVNTDIICRTLSDQKILAKMNMTMSFVVEKLSLFSKVNDNGTTGLDENLGKVLASVSVSTSRGFFSVHSATFNFSDAYLPIVDMSKFFMQPD